MKKIVMGCDHGGVEMKQELKKRLLDSGYEVIDVGTDSTASVDYPDYAVKAAKVVLSGDAECGIIICGTGIGISIAANKVRGIRAAHCTDPYSSRMAREHNNANMIALGARVTGIEVAWEICRSYLNAEFQGGRHAARVAKIDAIMDEI